MTIIPIENACLCEERMVYIYLIITPIKKEGEI
jgi:hypothetical protein